MKINGVNYTPATRTYSVAENETQYDYTSPELNELEKMGTVTHNTARNYSPPCPAPSSNNSGNNEEKTYHFTKISQSEYIELNTLLEATQGIVKSTNQTQNDPEEQRMLSLLEKAGIIEIKNGLYESRIHGLNIYFNSDGNGAFRLSPEENATYQIIIDRSFFRESHHNSYDIPYAD